MDANPSPTQLATQAAAALAERTGIDRHDIALTLGSGWAGAVDLIGETVAEIPASEIPGFSASGVHGHTGTLRSVRMPSGRHALLIGARTHLYEGRGVRAVAHGVRTAAAAGVRILILTNGAGSAKSEWPAGTVVLVCDHLNLTARSPLEGAAFVDLADAYSPRLRALARQVDPSLPSGVYAQLPGPHYETPAEIRMIRALGGDLVGMSTALETIAAREAGLEVLGLSLVTNPAAGVAQERIDHLALMAESRNAAPRIARLLADIVARIDGENDE